MDEDIGLLVAAYSILMCILRIIEWTGFVPLVYGVDDGVSIVGTNSKTQLSSEEVSFYLLSFQHFSDSSHETDVFITVFTQWCCLLRMDWLKRKQIIPLSAHPVRSIYMAQPSCSPHIGLPGLCRGEGRGDTIDFLQHYWTFVVWLVPLIRQCRVKFLVADGSKVYVDALKMLQHNGVFYH